MFTYYPQGVCSRKIEFDIDNGFVKSVHFTDGCHGNLQALSKLVEGMPVEEVITKLSGIICRNGTSCADQFTKALEDALIKSEAV